MKKSDDALDQAIDVIEGGYEFLLAYAAQGRRTDQGAGGSEGPRARLNAMSEALDDLPGLVRARAASSGRVVESDHSPFFDALTRDAAVAAAAVRLVLAGDEIGSQIVDNLNASIHLRALLTDLFLVDEALGG